MAPFTPQRWLILLGFVLPVLPARAQDGAFELSANPTVSMPLPLYVSFLEAGIGYQDINSHYLGRYGGPTARGPFAIVHGAFVGGDGWNAEGARRGSVVVDVFGFDAMSARVSYGVQGRWGVSAVYDGFTRAYADTARSPYIGVGSTSLALPSGWVSGALSSQFSELDSTLQRFETRIAWRTVGGEIVAQPRPGYEIRIGVSHRDREGIRGQNLAFGHEMNSAVGVFFPQPVDYKTDRLSASLAFANERAQWSASYGMSVFTNGNSSVSVPNPYNRSSNILWPGGALAGFPFSVGQYGLPPSSVAHQMSLSGAYRPSPAVRLTGRFSYTLQSQDEAFLPYTPSALLSVPDPPPRASLNGRVHKANVVLGFYVRPSSAFDASGTYTFDDRNNLSPMDLYSYVANDAQDQPQPLVPGASRYIRYNLPHSFTFHRIKTDIGMTLAPRTRFSLSYSGDFRARKYQQVANTTEHMLRAKVLRTFATGSSWLAFAISQRTGSRYDDALPWDLSHTDSYLAASPFNRSIEHPLLRKYNMANRRRVEGKGGLTFEPISSLTFDMTGTYAEDDYVDSPLGLQRAETLLTDASLFYVVDRRLNASVFYSFERIKSDLTGYLMGTVNLANPAQNWSTRNRDLIHTLGVKVEWHVVVDRFNVEAGYTVSDGISQASSRAASFAIYTVTAPLPDARYINHTLGLSGGYKIRSDTTLRIGYTFHRHRTSDWQYDGIFPASVGQILGSAIVSPRADAHVGWVTTRYAF